MSKKYLANNSITLPNTTDISVNKNINISTGVFTINNTFTSTGTSNKMYLPSSSNIFIGNITTTLTSISSSGVPSGLIIMWVASATPVTPPSGWDVCNGGNNTPNLVDKFILCSNGTPYTRGDTGGSSTVTLQAINIPAHTHPVSASSSVGPHNHEITTRGGKGTTVSSSYNPFNTVNTRDSEDGNKGNYANHKHSYTTPYGGGSATTVTPISILPRHYSVIYIMKR
jgi:hypothetical protein